MPSRKFKGIQKDQATGSSADDLKITMAVVIYQL
jgi:hypothetical protein